MITLDPAINHKLASIMEPEPIMLSSSTGYSKERCWIGGNIGTLFEHEYEWDPRDITEPEMTLKLIQHFRVKLMPTRGTQWAAFCASCRVGKCDPDIAQAVIGAILEKLRIDDESITRP